MKEADERAKVGAAMCGPCAEDIGGISRSLVPDQRACIHATGCRHDGPGGWLNYDKGVSLGEYDGEMRVHADDATPQNLWILAWRAEPESGEMRRDESYDGGLGGEQIEALRKLLNQRAAVSK